MAEFIDVGARIFPATKVEGDEGFAAMGKPVPFFRRQAAMDHAKNMGVESSSAMRAIGEMAECVARDEPYKALAVAMKIVDLTGSYRLLAVLCAASDPSKAEAN